MILQPKLDMRGRSKVAPISHQAAQIGHKGHSQAKKLKSTTLPNSSTRGATMTNFLKLATRGLSKSITNCSNWPQGILMGQAPKFGHHGTLLDNLLKSATRGLSSNMRLDIATREQFQILNRLLQWATRGTDGSSCQIWPPQDVSRQHSYISHQGALP